MSDKQQVAISSIQAGRNTGLLAPGGYGKSWVVDQTTTTSSVITAPTSTAALNIGGETMHSTFSLAPGIQTDKDMARFTDKMRTCFSGGVDKIVFDEIGAVRSDLLDAADQKLRVLYSIDKPFGGIPVVMSGDFLQLAPILSHKEKSAFRRYRYKSPFAFHSKVWEQLDINVVILDKCYRNENAEQLEMLNYIRLKEPDTLPGHSKPAWMVAVDYINDLATHGEYDPNSDLYICSYLKDVEKVNQKHYKEIDSTEFTYQATIKDKYRKDACVVPYHLNLKKGCRVIFCVNNEEGGYHNGLQGTVDYLDDEAVVVKADNGTSIVVEPNSWENVKWVRKGGKNAKVVEGTFTQLPLLLGYAASIHKVQGMTLNHMTMNLGKEAFAEGQVYVGTSRLRDMRNLVLARPLKYSDIKVSQVALDFTNRYR